MKDLKANKSKEKKNKQISFLENNKYIIEQCYSPGEGSCFAIWDGHTVEYHPTITKDDQIYEPIDGDDVTKGLVSLPVVAQDYGDEEQLVSDIKEFLKTWLGVSESYYTIATYYILTTWVYDKFDTINYLRALGDTGVGKSRFLDTIGSLCYKFTLVSGAVTPAPVFRLLEKWKGTLGIEEGDLKESDETNEIIKILNCGFEKGKPVVRCDKNQPDKIDTFEVYGPKVMVTRREFYDQATEARCLTEIMIQDGSKPDTKTEEFYSKRTELRNKLLMFRFKNYYTVNVKKALEIDLKNLEPRLRQASRGFLALVWDKPKLLHEFKIFLKEYNDSLIESRSTSWEGQAVTAIAELLIDSMENITCKDIADKIDNDKITFRKVGNIIKRLKLELSPKFIENKTKKVLVLDMKILSILFDRYIPDPTLRENAKNSKNLGNNFGNNFVVGTQKNITEITDISDTTKILNETEAVKGSIEEEKQEEGLKTETQPSVLAPPSRLGIVGNLGNSVIISKDITDTLMSLFATKKEVEIQEFLSIYPEDFHQSINQLLENLKKDGEIFEARSGFIKLL